MRTSLPAFGFLIVLLAPVPGSAQSGPYGYPPRDVYGNVLVVPRSGAAPQGYADDRYGAAYGRRGGRTVSPGNAIDPMVGYPYESPTATRRPVGNTLASLPPADDFFDEGGGLDYAIAPQFQRQVVAYRGREQPGTVVIDTPAKYLYLIQPGGRAIRYGIGVGRPGFEWAGRKQVTQKKEWPDWRPPSEMLKRRPDLPVHMEGGPENPLGARALYLGSTLYRIHGTNEPDTIGHAVSSGCIRMLNKDVIDLYNRVPVGAEVLVI